MQAALNTLRAALRVTPVEKRGAHWQMAQRAAKEAQRATDPAKAMEYLRTAQYHWQFV